MNKKLYTKPSIEAIHINSNTVITASDTTDLETVPEIEPREEE